MKIAFKANKTNLSKHDILSEETVFLCKNKRQIIESVNISNNKHSNTPSDLQCQQTQQESNCNCWL